MKENNERKVCSRCGVIIEGEAYEFDGHIFCEDCLNDKTAICDVCGRRVWSDGMVSDSERSLCYDCYDRSYTTCEDCGRIIHYDDACYFNDDDVEDCPYCYACYENKKKASIKSYGYKPEPIFYGSGNFFMGVELEIDKGGEDDGNAGTLLDIANFIETRIYCKHDGSIDNGFEIVSHPMSLEYHTDEMNWQKIFDEAVNMDYRSHNTATCGLHIHVNRSVFGENREQQEEVIGRIVFFVEKHWNELVKLSRRSMYNLNRWAAKYATISDTTKETYKKAKDKSLGRYVAVNLSNYNTVEFRMFRGTLLYSTFIATLQLVYEICRFAILLSDEEVECLSWSDFVCRIPANKKELIDYLIKNDTTISM